jgi:hypothetical protein
MDIADLQFSIAAAGPPGQQDMEVSPQAGSNFGLGVPVPAPPLVPQPLNLVRSSRNPNDGNTLWTQGFTYLPNAIGDLTLVDDCSPAHADVPAYTGSTKAQWKPYILQASFTCSAFGWSENNYADRARELLDAATAKMVEFEFWHGALAKAAGYGNLFLTQTTGADVYAATSVQEAVGICEQYISQKHYGGRGMIHMPPVLSPYLQLVTRREGNLLLTNRDTIVVPGTGYGVYAQAATNPPPMPAGPFVVVGTGIVDVRLTDISVFPDDPAQTLDRSTNTVEVRAERYACASWDGITFCHVNTTVTL